ncbi:MAG: hypothetical protein MUF30_00755 [Burkholderiales bacterium]|jgi:anti-anti-sigma regulatory factor|nr:hypothetical protein [Burkholderiales bacterium]
MTSAPEPHASAATAGADTALAAALAYASGAAGRARELLEDAIMGGADDRRPWRMLASLHAREGRFAAADALEGRYRLRFGEPAPEERARQRADARLPAVLQRDGAAAVVFGGRLDDAADGAFERLDAIATAHPIVRVDLARVTAIEPAGGERLRARIEALVDAGVGVVLTGAGRAVQVLARAIETEADPSAHWALLLLAHRLLHDAPAFERAAIEYALATNQPQPQWEPVLMPHPDGGSTDERRGAPRFGGREMLPLRGQMLGDDAAEFARIDAWAADNRWVNLDCSALVRIDRGAAQRLATRLAGLAAAGHVVRLLHVDPLIAPLLEHLGVTAAAVVAEA